MTDTDQKTKVAAFDIADPARWADMLKTGIPKIYSMLIRRKVNPALAEELTQKTVFDAIKGKHTFDPEKGSPDTWLLAIANNNLAAELRKRSIREIPGSELVSYIEAIDRRLLPDEVLEKTETALLVRGAMDRLDEKERKVLQAKYIDGHNAITIGRDLGISQKAVHNLLYRARISLRDKLKSLAPSVKEAQPK